MIPSRPQFRRWSYPAKFGFVSFFVGLGVTLALWMFPDTGKNLIASLSSEKTQQSLPVPGSNGIERQINLAKMQGAASTTPSAEFAVAVPFARPTMPQEQVSTDWPSGLVALSNASPLRSSNQDVVFAPGRCRFIGTVFWSDRAKLQGEANISLMSCVLDNGDAYGVGSAQGPSIGFVAPLDDPTSRTLSLVADTRMKDFFDIAVIAQRTDLDGATLARAIAATFARRGTTLPTQAPTALTRAFGDDDAKRRQWQAFLNKSRVAVAAGTLPQTVTLLHTLLWPATQVAASSSDATAVWKAPERRWR